LDDAIARFPEYALVQNEMPLFADLALLSGMVIAS
jgi:hypothetical protein